MKCGLLGRKLGHSYSPQIHAHLGSYSYELFEREPEEVEAFLRDREFTAINVTIPYKKTVMPYCHLTDTARYMGSVNTVIRQPDGRLLGHNTDYFGFSSMVKKSGLNVADKKCLVLGSGGASVTAVAVLKEMGARVIVISRSGENNYDNLYQHQDASVICNCTPVGMYPNNGVAPLDLGQFPQLEGVLDMIYNPARTQLLLEAEKRGLIAENGLWMLVAQAKEASEWFTGNTIDNSIIGNIHRQLKLQMENIILIGMPGCGKSTVGKLLADRLGRKFVDADAEIVNAAGMSIPEIFAHGGEESFRQIETQVLSDLGKKSGLVIATGGGCITRERNYPLLHQNGTCIWLTRDLDQLPTDGRPLSQTGGLEQMYRVRKPLYEHFADISVPNHSTPEACAEAVLKLLNQGD